MECVDIAKPNRLILMTYLMNTKHMILIEKICILGCRDFINFNATISTRDTVCFDVYVVCRQCASIYKENHF